MGLRSAPSAADSSADRNPQPPRPSVLVPPVHATNSSNPHSNRISAGRMVPATPTQKTCRPRRTGSLGCAASSNAKSTAGSGGKWRSRQSTSGLVRSASGWTVTRGQRLKRWAAGHSRTLDDVPRTLRPNQALYRSAAALIAAIEVTETAVVSSSARIAIELFGQGAAASIPAPKLIFG